MPIPGRDGAERVMEGVFPLGSILFRLLDVEKKERDLVPYDDLSEKMFRENNDGIK